MTNERSRTSASRPVEGFGPIKQHLSDGRKDHKKGWEEEHKHKAQGGHIAPINPKRILVKTSLADQFRKRMAEGKDIKG